MPCYDDRDAKVASECPRRTAVVSTFLCNLLQPEPIPVIKAFTAKWYLHHCTIDSLAKDANRDDRRLEQARDVLRRFELETYDFMIEHRFLEKV